MELIDLPTSPKLAAYVSAWNVVANTFDWESSLRRMSAFFDHVVVAVNTSTDDSFARIKGLGLPNVEVIQTAFCYLDITFDGAIKNAALQACPKGPEWVYVQMDLDEMVPQNQRALWRQCAQQLLSIPSVDCFMLPTIDLWGSMKTVRADKSAGIKFRIHKGGLTRGVWKEAWRDGRSHFDTSKSDSCELLTPTGNLATAMQVVPPQFLAPSLTAFLKGHPYTVHLGYVSFDQRVKVNKAIWKDHWELRSGHRENVATEKTTLENYPLIEHKLDL